MKSWILILLSTIILAGCGNKPAEPVGTAPLGGVTSQDNTPNKTALASDQKVATKQEAGSSEELTDEEDAESTKETPKSSGPLKIDFSHWTSADMVGAWGRLYNGLVDAPKDVAAKEFGCQTLTFYPNGTFVCEGYQAFMKFKKSGSYSVANGQLIMHDLKKISASDPTVWDLNWMDITSSKFENYYGCKINVLPMINISASGNLAFVKYLTFDEKSMCYRYVTGVEVELSN